jgi:hypothetical protein
LTKHADERLLVFCLDATLAVHPVIEIGNGVDSGAFIATQPDT